MNTIYDIEDGTSRDKDMATYHSDALERGIPRRNMVSLKGSLAVEKTVSVDAVADNSSEGVENV